jgi:putative two-component system response regulator
MMKTESKYNILVVDDTETNIDILANALDTEYDVSVAMDGESALDIAHSAPPDLILLDIMMPGMDGFEVCERLKESADTAEIPVLFLTAMTEMQNKTKGFEIGAVDYITKPFEIREVEARVRTHLKLKEAKDFLANQNEILEKKVEERTRELVLTQDVTIQSLASLAETRDNETGAHIQRTQNYVSLLTLRLMNVPNYIAEIDPTTAQLLHKSASLHDIGKVGVPDSILLKPGKLTSEEFEEMKKHAIYGRDALQRAEKALGSNSFLRLAKEIAYSHHEKWDGSGYPEGLRGEEIPVPGRIMAIADVYDALICKRVYKPAFPHKKAIEIIKEGRGTHFCPDVTDAFLVLEKHILKVAHTLADSEEEREALGS